MQKEKIFKSYKWLLKKIPYIPEIVVVLGSGLGELENNFSVDFSLPYEEIEGFPVSTAPGHLGKLVFTEIEGKKVAFFCGRFHLYEGYSPWEAVFGLRVMGLLGAEVFILTNAAGALNPQFEVGELMLITDHINFTGENPLLGENISEFGPRFPDMSQVYCEKLQQKILKIALEEKIVLYKGVYIQVKGPSLETPAETRVFRAMGADAIGMSTSLEAIALKHMNKKIIGISCLTNKNLPDCMQETSEEEILAVARNTNAKLAKLLLAGIRAL